MIAFSFETEGLSPCLFRAEFETDLIIFFLLFYVFLFYIFSGSLKTFDAAHWNFYFF